MMMGCNSFFRSFGPEEEVEKGVRVASIVLGGNHQVRRMVFDPGALIPNHRHPEDVVTLILEGRMEMTVGCETRTIGPGEVFLVPANADHGGRVLDDRVVAVSFSRKA